eukprot:gnl/TRDRNA2_/TRDRNA2_41984_c0_seq1.p1 gnl/TRDRNA2_/TRDRNA2_41984_c0~~gnl/TRDRNA2_/TRDRNA2_41984_c0_seq1.p1  ORF type:complete len:432 (-),score=75.30 gnl/TRDRNA2_/TRDRNA2_41984_c0_seq1:86-1381(-)
MAQGMGNTASSWNTGTQGATTTSGYSTGTHAFGETGGGYSLASANRQNVRIAQETYSPMTAKARGVKIHNGPPELTKSIMCDRTAWVKDDKQYNPYSYLHHPNNTAPPKPSAQKGQQEYPLFHPKRNMDPPKKTKKPKKNDEADEAEETKGEEDETKNKKKVPKENKDTRPPWDMEHHIMVSRGNHEVQPLFREYFDRPLRKDNEGVPKVYEMYCMNDRQCGWRDTPAPLGEPRRTYLENVGPFNMGGCKDQQLVSWWRKTVGKSSSVPDLYSTKSNYELVAELDPRSKDMPFELLTALATTPARQSVDFWREWSSCSKLRLPPKKEELDSKGKLKKKKTKLHKKEEPEKVEEPPPVFPPTPRRKGRHWDERWHVSWSKDNEGNHVARRTYFTNQEFHSGAVWNHPTEKLKPSKAAPTAQDIYTRNLTGRW